MGIFNRSAPLVPLAIPDELVAESHVRSGARVETQVADGTVLIASDFHLVPGIPPTTAFRAFVMLCKKLQPALVCVNGDVLDAAISANSLDLAGNIGSHSRMRSPKHNNECVR
jgi:hypothetical protein